MSSLTSATILLGWLFLAAITLILVASLLTGGISLRGLLHVKSPTEHGVVASLSPARVQLLIATLTTAAMYFNAIMSARGTGQLPDVDTRLLYGLGASHGLYLASKVGKFVPLLDIIRRLSP